MMNLGELPGPAIGPLGDGALGAIGNTPLVRLRNYFRHARASVHAKLELFNATGGSKSRAAASMLQAAIQEGDVTPGETTIIESTSGNTGVALASVCKYYQLPLVCVVDAHTTIQHRKLIKAFGGRVEVISTPDPATGELLPARLRRVQELLAVTRPSFCPDQYSNVHNARAHHATCREIFEQLGRPPDYIFCATSTCGTIRGCGDYVRELNAPTSMIAVDAVGSRIFGQRPQRRRIPGLGSAIRPPLVDGATVARVVHVGEPQAIRGSRRLLESEAILAGGSSGAVMAALASCHDILRSQASVVVVLADSGERYLDTIFNDSWVDEHIEVEELAAPHIARA